MAVLTRPTTAPSVLILYFGSSTFTPYLWLDIPFYRMQQMLEGSTSQVQRFWNRECLRDKMWLIRCIGSKLVRQMSS